MLLGLSCRVRAVLAVYWDASETAPSQYTARAVLAVYWDAADEGC
jgi:hypothetical protein